MAFATQIDATTTVLAGIKWDVAESGMGRAEARVRAKGASAQVFVLRAGDRNLGSTALPGKAVTWRDKNIVSFAGTLADANGREAWCGVFEYEGKFAFVATGEGGTVFPDGDKVFELEHDARERFESERPLVSVTYAPASWQIEGAKDADELLGAIDWAAATPMQPIGAATAKRPAVALLGGAAILAAGFAGWQYWQNVEDARKAEELAKAPPPPPNPWVQKPKPYNATAACFGVRGRLADLAHLGWALDKVECNLEGSTYSAVLNSFSVDAALPTLEPGTNLKLKGDGTGIEVTGPLAPSATADRTAEQADLRTALAARNLIVASVGSIAWQNAGGNRNQFTFKTPANLEELASKLNALPTLSLNRMEYSGGQWSVDGEVFN